MSRRRPVPPAAVALATQATAPLLRAHGAPVHAGDPPAIGVADVQKPDFGDAVDFEDGIGCRTHRWIGEPQVVAKDFLGTKKCCNTDGSGEKETPSVLRSVVGGS